MGTTRPSLLERVKRRGDEAAWREFFAIYAPMISRFARSRGLSEDESEDVAQSCMEKLSQTMATFDYQQDRGSFKNYVFTLTRHEIASRCRRKHPDLATSRELRSIPSAPDEAQQEWEHHWVSEHLAYCLARLTGEFSPESIEAFKLYALNEWPVERVCDTLGMSSNQVYLAKSRILKRLRSELTTMIGDIL